MLSPPIASSTPTILASGNDGGVGLSDPATAQRRRKMLDLINRLRNTGVQSDIDLPMIAVIGNQSAGKSSLIESISGVTLPRSSGTCTRCPTECRLTYADTPWTCTVKLHFITDKLGAPIKGRVISFGGAISTKADVEDRIRRAQHAILNPSTDPDTFLDSATVLLPGNETSFSRNYVSLEIKGRDLADLSFVDLPGLIASVSQDGNDHDIDLVKSLVVSYIEKASCVILLTVACETDFENQGAHHLAKQHDPEGKRTVGVLTKPDRIPQGEEASWRQLIQNEVEPLVNNWYCVKQPSSQAIKAGIDWAGARRQEREYFASTKPWCDLDSYYQSFLCTTKLTERLSTILAELITKRLPEIQEELYRVVQETERELSSLPKEPSGDSVGEVLRVLGDFHKELSERLEGTPGQCGLIQLIRARTERFKDIIHATAPEFIPWGRNETPRHPLPAMAFLANEERVGKGDGDNDNYTSDDNHISKKRKRDCSSDNIYIDDVMERAQRARTRELPDNYPFVVQKNYICEILQAWKEPAFDFVRAYFQVTYKRFVDMVPMAIDHEIVRGLGRGLDQALREGLQLTGSDAYERCSAMLQEPSRISMRRQEVLKKMERLREAKKELRKLNV
ncbi:hypothetical protein SCLCIDRAFT_1222690 [Scleroderma citrinum Foug A]|uniref:GED domain-containing protein n=1 Tax=Scleroderma citrinum Foug A TaxID=1036808 RepID=A0A0C2YV07_9AGAM|nr:hypothetical protein SCLCIDRAFT_1222690 [Scleroderma citrinum Foug A]